MSETSYPVRPVSADDRDTWQKLWGGYLDFYKSDLDDAIYDATWRRLLSDDQHFGGFVAVDDNDTPVGLTHYVLHASTWTEAPYCYLEDLYVSPDLRGGGVGRGLIAAVRERAEQLGCARLYWMTQDNNYKGRLLYDQVAERIPFVVYERML
jgi:GNAT superfamily N-acetyltransferase